MKADKQNALRALFSFAGEAKGRMTLSVLLALVGEIFGMAPYFAVALLARQLLEGTATVQSAALVALSAALCMCLRAWLTGASSMRSHGISFTILKNIRFALADKMARVPMGVMLETPSGTFKTLLVDNVGRLEDIIAHMVPEFPSNLSAPLLSIALVFAMDWRMGLACFVTVPVSLVFMVGMMHGYGEKMATYLLSGNEMNAALVEYVGGIQVVKAFGQGRRSFGHFADSVRFFHDSMLAWWKQCWFWMAGFKAVLPSTLLGTLPLGTYLYMTGSLELPIFLACVILSIGFMPGLMKFGFGLEQLTYMAANLKPIQDFLATPEQHRPQQPARLGERAFRFEGVGFSYDGETQVLRDMSFTAAPGQVTAIVGPSGSGKSTVAKLMAGFWDATEGTVSFGGVDIRDMPFDQLMDEVSYVAQDNFLFDLSIRENIRLGKPDADDRQLQEALEAACAWDFVSAMDGGLNASVGEHGHGLSEGQAQRIAIARALLRDAPVLLLDEATSALDVTTERTILRNLAARYPHKTCIVTTHRPTVISLCRRVYQVSGGRMELLDNDRAQRLAMDF